MASIVVRSSADIQQIIDQLTQLNRDFRNKATDINQEQTTLTTKWEGNASTAFQDNFKREYPNFENFATAIDEYIEGLKQILDEYERAEEMNKQIADT